MNHDTDPSLNCPNCQVVSPFLDFTVDGLGGDLPSNHFRCPECRYQWEMKAIEPVRIIPSRYPGESPLIIPPKRIRTRVTHPTL